MFTGSYVGGSQLAAMSVVAANWSSSNFSLSFPRIALGSSTYQVNVCPVDYLNDYKLLAIDLSKFLKVKSNYPNATKLHVH